MTLARPADSSSRRWGRRVGVDAAAGMLIAVVVRAGRIVSARQVNLTMPPAGAIRAALGARRVGAPPVHVALSDPDDVHRTMLLPPMTAAERAEVVRRDRSREGDETKAVAWHVMRRVEVDGVPNDEVLVVLASQAGLERVLEPILAEGVVPGAVVTGPLALMAAAAALAPTPLDRPTALVHWGQATLTIVVVSEGVLKFARVIAPPAVDLDPFDWIPVEIDRSIRHYAFISKGERVEQVMMSVAGASGASRLLAGGELAQRLRLTVINLNALLAPALPMGATAELAPGAFTLAYGAALLRSGDVPSLLPPVMAVQRRSRQVIEAAVAAGVAVLLLLGSSATVLAQREQGLRDRLRRAQAVGQADRTRIDQAAQAEAERQRMRELARLLTEDPLHLLPPTDALREIARRAPGDLRLDQLTMTVDDQGYVFSLTGRVEREDFTEAQRTLNEFYYSLRGSPLFHTVEIRQTSRVEASAPAEAAHGSTAGEPPSAGAAAPVPTVTGPGGGRPLAFVVVAKLRRLA